MPTVTEIWTGRGGTVEEDGQRSYRRVFRVVTNSPLVTVNEVRFATGIPRLGDFYVTSREFDLSARVRRVDPQQGEDPTFWTVTVEYASLARGGAALGAGGAPGGGSRGLGVGAGPQNLYLPNPILRPAQIEFDSDVYQKAIHKDIYDDPIVNTAGDRFDPPIEVDAARPTVTIKKNFLTFNMALALTYVNTINSDSFLGCDPGQLKIQKISAVDADEHYEDPITQIQLQVTYVAASVVMQGRFEGWKERVANVGFYELVSGVRIRIMDHGMPVASPVPLNFDGTRLAVGGTIKFREFDVYRPKAFTDLGLF